MIWEIDEKSTTIEGVDLRGRADPAYAAALGLLPAPLGRRALAAVVDACLGMLLLLPFLLGSVPLLLKLASGSISPYGFLNHPDFVRAVVLTAVTVLLGLVYLVVQLILHGTRGLTIGKALTGIRTVEVRTLGRPRVWRVVVRVVLVGVSGIVPVLGPAFVLASPTFDTEHRGRGLHDSATGVWLVDVRRGLNPYDEKRMRIARKMVKTAPAPERAALPSLATAADPDALPAYRPGTRVSAGILGMARPYESRERPVVGLSLATPTAEPAPAAPGTPVLGGYRMPAPEPSAPGAPASAAPAPAAAPASVAQSSAAPTSVAQTSVAPAPVPSPPSVAPAPLAPSSSAAPASVTPPPPVASPVPPPTAPPLAFGLRFETGELIRVADPVLIGRNPDAAEHPGTRAIALVDDSRSLSKTHVLVRPIADGLEITDRHSTNGSAVVRGGTEHRVTPGTPVVTGDGDVVRLGDRVATVVRVAPGEEGPR